VYGTDSHRTLTFDKGALQSASSNHPDDRLNKVLVRMGVMTPASVESVMRSLEPPARLGKLLVEQGYISRPQLFDLLNKQTEEIFFSAILEIQGSYAFVVGDESGVQPSTIAHIPVQELLLRGAERLDSLKQFESLVPDIELCPEMQTGVEVTQLDPKTRMVLAMSNGERSLREIATETWLGKFETMKITRELVKKGQVRLRPRTPSTQEEIRRLVGSFNELLRYIFSTVEQHGSVVQTREEINRWLEKSTRAGLVPGGVGEDGSIALDPSLTAARRNDDLQLAGLVRETLYALASFALFAASLSLPLEEERKLAQEVYRRLRVLEF
jgi:HAMP domain-containing protein